MCKYCAYAAGEVLRSSHGTAVRSASFVQFFLHLHDRICHNSPISLTVTNTETNKVCHSRVAWTRTRIFRVGFVVDRVALVPRADVFSCHVVFYRAAYSFGVIHKMDNVSVKIPHFHRDAAFPRHKRIKGNKRP